MDRETTGTVQQENLPGTAMLETVLHELAEPITVIDTEFRVMYMNRAARDLFAQHRDSRDRAHCYRVSHHRATPCSGDDHPCPMTQVRDTGGSVRVLHDHYDGEGARRVVEIIASPLRDADGALVGIIESQRDVTAREKAKEKIKRYAAELERSNRIKDLFIDIMRHDLLSPAGVIRSAATLSLRDETGSHKREDLDLIHRSSQKMIDLIQNASALAKIETERSLALAPMDIGAMIKDVVRDLAPEAARHGVQLSIGGCAKGTVPANPLLASVFSNLIGNAIKYSPANSEVRIDITRDAGGCRISVIDQGEGIPDAAKEAIFTRFTRLHKGRVKGTGLGLAIVKKVVELHGGRSWVEDAPGGGSVFVVQLKSADERVNGGATAPGDALLTGAPGASSRR